MTMQSTAVRKITISLPGELVQFADQVARQAKTSRSQIISQLLAEERLREQEQLAAEGYRFYAQEAAEFAEASAVAAAEAWSVGFGGESDDDREAW